MGLLFLSVDEPLAVVDGEPWYISFLRLTPGVASSVALSFFWHFAQTMVVSSLHWTVLIGVDAGGWILGLNVQVGGDVIRHRLGLMPRL